MPAIVGPISGGEASDRTAHHQLLKLAYEGAPDRFLEVLQRVITAEDERHSHVFIVEKIEGCWDSRIAAALSNRVQRRDLKSGCMVTLLVALLRHRDPAALAIADSLVLNPPPAPGRDCDYSIEAACSLLEFGEGAWGVVWPVVIADAAWGKSVFERICQGQSGGSFVARLAESQLAELLDWLFCHYSPLTDPDQRGAHYVSPDESVRLWRDRLLGHLQERGTAAAEAEVAKLRNKHPSFPWLHWVTLRAARARQRKDWVPATPRQIIDLAIRKEKRFVASGQQLVDVLVESLERLQHELHGETPMVEFLWDTSVRRPKNENSLSNFIKTP